MEWTEKLYEYWGTPDWSDNDQLLYDMTYNQYRITGTV
jgi:hypothetical protein